MSLLPGHTAQIKSTFLAILLLITAYSIKAQQFNAADCQGALPICDPINEGIGTVLAVGDVLNEVNPNISCVDHENYSTWYKFTPTTNGTFNFVLTPNDNGDDYDWALFDITNSSCDQIPIDGDLLVSCNSWGDFGFNGQTGISSANGGTGNSNGPGTFNGPPFNEDYNVTAGHNYVLMVSNWSNSTQGFTMNTSASTADGIYADTKLTIAPDQLICPSDTVNIWSNFSGSILNNSLTYQWSPSGLFVDPAQPDPELKAPLQNSVNLKLTVNNGGCETSKTMKVTVGTINYNKENLSQDVCLGEVSRLDINYSGNVIEPGLSFNWSPGYLLDDSTRIIPTTVQLQDTTQFVFHIKNGPCEIIDSLKVYIYSDTVSADFDYTFNDLENTIPVEVDFENFSIGDAYSRWDFGDSSGISTIRSPTHGFPGYDTYTIQLVSISPSQVCTDTAIKTIEFPEVVYPNIITPNGDGINDLLRITGLKIGTDLTVYNRWGKRVYQQNDYLHDWDGLNAPEGTYYYEFRNPDGTLINGWIRISR